MLGKIYNVDSKTACEFLMPKHYSGRKPNISKAYAWHVDGEIKAVLTVGKPASNTLCDGICGKENSKYVYELNRLCRLDDWSEPLSPFVSGCLRRVRGMNENRGAIIVSYADRGMSHCGYIYQACNFLYTGATKQRTEQYTEGNKHSRHSKSEDQGELRKVRTSKHRYVFFCTHYKKQRRAWMRDLNYKILDYPKEVNENYTLGEYMKPILVLKNPHNTLTNR
jgi:hypothetical protein